MATKSLTNKFRKSTLSLSIRISIRKHDVKDSVDEIMIIGGYSDYIACMKLRRKRKSFTKVSIGSPIINGNRRFLNLLTRVTVKSPNKVDISSSDSFKDL